MPQGGQAVRQLGVVTAPDVGTPGPATVDSGHDGRGSWIPNRAMIATRFMELRKRRGLMITLIALTIGLPTLFLVIRLLLHAFVPHSYGPAGGFDVFTTLIAGVLYIFGFIAAMTLGATAGCSDLADGMFTQQVVTGRSRVALYLARIPAGLAIIIPMLAVAFTIICAVCVFSAPSSFDFQGTTVPLGLSLHGYETWAADHPNLIICDFPYNGPCPGERSSTQRPAVQGAGRATGRTELSDLRRDLQLAALWLDDQGRTVARARGDRRLRLRSRVRLSHGTTNGSDHPDDRVRDHLPTAPLVDQDSDSLPDQPSATPGHRTGCGPFRTGRDWYQLRDRERTRWASRLVVLGAGVDCHRGRSDRGLAGGVDGPGRVENGDAGRLRNAWLDFAVYCKPMVPVLLGARGPRPTGGAGARYSGLSVAPKQT